MLTSAVFNNAKWYEKSMYEHNFNAFHAPEPELLIFQQMVFQSVGYQQVNSQGNSIGEISPHHVSVRKVNDLEQVIKIDTLVSAEISGIHYRLVQKRNNPEEKVAETTISLTSPEFDIEHQIQFNQKSGLFLKKIGNDSRF